MGLPLNDKKNLVRLTLLSGVYGDPRLNKILIRGSPVCSMINALTVGRFSIVSPSLGVIRYCLLSEGRVEEARMRHLASGNQDVQEQVGCAPASGVLCTAALLVIFFTMPTRYRALSIEWCGM